MTTAHESHTPQTPTPRRAVPAQPSRLLRFDLGRIVATPAALSVLERADEDPLMYLARHGSGDWGEVCPSDAAANDAAVAHEDDPDRQSRVLSSYRTAAGDRLWIITEADRSATTVLLPEEY